MLLDTIVVKVHIKVQSCLQFLLRRSSILHHLIKAELYQANNVPKPKPTKLAHSMSFAGHLPQRQHHIFGPQTMSAK